MRDNLNSFSYDRSYWDYLPLTCSLLQITMLCTHSAEKRLVKDGQNLHTLLKKSIHFWDFKRTSTIPGSWFPTIMTLLICKLRIANYIHAFINFWKTPPDLMTQRKDSSTVENIRSECDIALQNMINISGSIMIRTMTSYRQRRNSTRKIFKLTWGQLEVNDLSQFLGGICREIAPSNCGSRMTGSNHEH